MSAGTGRTGTIDTASPAFAARLASVLRTQRRTTGSRLRDLARASEGAFSVGQLRGLEAGHLDLDGIDLVDVASLYRVDLLSILLDRVTLLIDREGGRIQTAGITRSFEPENADAMLCAYLTLVRDLRELQHEPTILLRRDDIEVLALTLDTDGPTVIERLGVLMSMTVAQRRSLMLAFATGATLVALAGAVVVIDDDGNEPADPAEDIPAASVPMELTELDAIDDEHRQ